MTNVTTITGSIATNFGPITASGTLIGNDTNDFLISGTIAGQSANVFLTNGPPSSGAAPVRGSQVVNEAALTSHAGTVVSGTGNQPGVGNTALVAPESANIVYSRDNSAAPCFVAGTMIRTERGDIAVEELVVGDLVVTTSGAYRPIRWLGHRTIDCHAYAHAADVLPIVIRAHAFGDHRPARDLWVSPGHAICVDLVGEVLIPASSLVNGATVTQMDVERVTYWHVELEGGHDILLAENLPTESYIDVGNRAFFVENDLVAFAAVPDGTTGSLADYCRPFHVGGPAVAATRARLAARAIESGWSLDVSPFAGLHLVADGTVFAPSVDELTASFVLPINAKDVWLVSETISPVAATGSPDWRQLGVFISALSIDDREAPARRIALDDALLAVGFHEVEGYDGGCRRWTNGRAKLPAALWNGCGTTVRVRVELAGPALPRWIAPARIRENTGLQAA